MGGYDSAFNSRNGRLNNDDQTREMTLEKTGRPDYDLLWRKAGRLVKTAAPTPKQHIDAWVIAHDNLEDALLHTSRYFDDGSTGDIIKTEQRLVSGALDETHDFLKLYAEVIKQPPPDDLQLIEQVLRHRRESLQQLHPTRFPQP
jgi:hypothetical protein